MKSKWDDTEEEEESENKYTQHACTHSSTYMSTLSLPALLSPPPPSPTSQTAIRRYHSWPRGGHGEEEEDERSGGWYECQCLCNSC